MRMHKTSGPLALVLLVLVTAPTTFGQSLQITLDPASASTFNTGPTGMNAALTDIVLSEAADIVLTTTPTIPIPPPAQLQPRAVALFIGIDLPGGQMFPEGTLFIDPMGALPPIELFNSFVDPFAPFFGPPLQGASNTISITIGADLFGLLPLPTLTFQALAADLPGNPALLSNPVRLTLVDPETIPALTPTVTDINPKSLTPLGNNRPQGNEAGGNVVMISGTSFLAQSDWVRFPPTVTFGGIASPQISILDNTTMMVVVPPTLAPTMPPMTSACLVDVIVTANSMVVPSGAPVTAPLQYLYTTGLVPVITGFDVATGTPEGGEARMTLGTDFLDGLLITFTSQANPLLTETIAAPPAIPGAGGTTIAFTTPVFCTGPVDVVVTNCDEEFSNTFTFDYVALQPTLASGAPTVTTAAGLMGITFIAINETGTALTLNGTNYLPPDSPLATSPNVIPGSFYPTRTFLDGVLEAGLLPPAGNRTTITGMTQAFTTTGVFRPELGFKDLRVENPPCVNTGNASPLSNPPCAPLTPPCTAVVQDDLPPTITDVFPAIAVATGMTYVEVRGSNFFSVQNGVMIQDFTPFANPGGEITSIDPTQLVVPAVLFGSRFSPEVELLDSQRLRVRVPVAAMTTGTTTVAVTVFNPDVRSGVAPITFTYVPPLTDPTRLLDPLFPTIDATILELIARGIGGAPTVIPGGAAGAAPALAFARNPSPAADREQDPIDPMLIVPPGVTAVSYDYVFLFNTFDPDPMSPTGGTRLFEFDEIDFPATLTLPLGGVALVPAIDPTLPSLGQPLSTFAVPVNTTVRVIVKACGFTIGTDNRLLFNNDRNPPLVLMSHDDLVIDAIVDLGGDAFFFEETSLLFNSPVGGPFRVRVDQTFPPAGAGQGGRGGAYFPSGLVQLPGPNFGVSPGILAGGDGLAPGSQFMIPPPGPRTQGRAGLGAAPIGVQAGAGGGAGYTTLGVAGMSGTSPGGPGGLTFGNLTNGPMMPPLGAPADDRNIYGAAAADFLGFSTQAAFLTGLLYGGSGGGGGGGGLAIFIPALTLGGRGGNGGGCLVMVSDRLLRIGPGGVLAAHGETGQLGVDAFPLYNSNPVIPVNFPGSGGSGAGGTIYGLAIADVCFDYGLSTICGTAPPPLPIDPLIDVSGGLTGPAQVAANPGVPAGGAGGEGRIRFAIPNVSPYVADFTTEITGLFNQNALVPMPPNFVMLPPDFFAFPLP